MCGASVSRVMNKRPENRSHAIKRKKTIKGESTQYTQYHEKKQESRSNVESRECWSGSLLFMLQGDTSEKARTLHIQRVTGSNPESHQNRAWKQMGGKKRTLSEAESKFTGELMRPLWVA